MHRFYFVSSIPTTIKMHAYLSRHTLNFKGFCITKSLEHGLFQFTLTRKHAKLIQSFVFTDNTFETCRKAKSGMLFPWQSLCSHHFNIIDNRLEFCASCSGATCSGLSEQLQAESVEILINALRQREHTKTLGVLE